MAIMGPSGCGKTTLLNLLGGVDRPSGGTIKIDSDNLTTMNGRSSKHRLLHVGFVFQFFNLIPSITASENPRIADGNGQHTDKECHERARTLLGMVGLEAKGQKRPEELSGGEQQRVAIALALANDPALIPQTSRRGTSTPRMRGRLRAVAYPGDRLWKDGHHGQSRPQDRRAFSDRVLDARRPVCEGGLIGRPVIPKAQPPRV